MRWPRPRIRGSSVPRGSAATCWKTRMRDMPARVRQAGRACTAGWLSGHAAGRSGAPPFVLPVRITAMRLARSGAMRLAAARAIEATRRSCVAVVIAAVRMRLAIAADAQRLARDAHALEVVHDLARHALGQVDQAEVVADVDAADVAALELRLVGDGADDVAGLHAMAMAHFDTEGFHALFGGAAIAMFARRTRGAGRLIVEERLRRVVAAGRCRGSRGGGGRGPVAAALRSRPFAVELATGPAFATVAILAATRIAERGPVEARLLEAATFAMRTQLLRRDLQQQWHVALHQLGQGGGDLHRRDVLLALVALDQIAEHRQFRAFQGGGDAAEELRHTLLVHRLDAGQFHLLDRLAGGSLDRAQHAAFARGDEQDRLALAARAAGAADAVDVALGVVGDVEVQHVADARDIEAARGHVGGDRDVAASVLDRGDGALARLLVHVAVDGGGGNAARGQLVGQFLGAELGTREHDHRVVGFGFEDAGHRIELVHAAHCPVALADVGGGGGRGLDRDLDRL